MKLKISTITETGSLVTYAEPDWTYTKACVFTLTFHFNFKSSSYLSMDALRLNVARTQHTTTSVILTRPTDGEATSSDFNIVCSRTLLFVTVKRHSAWCSFMSTFIIFSKSLTSLKFILPSPFLSAFLNQSQIHLGVMDKSQHTHQTLCTYSKYMCYTLLRFHHTWL